MQSSLHRIFSQLALVNDRMQFTGWCKNPCTVRDERDERVHGSHAGGKMAGGEGEMDDTVVVIPPLVATHLRALAEVLLRNDERRALGAYIDVRIHSSVSRALCKGSNF